VSPSELQEQIASLNQRVAQHRATLREQRSLILAGIEGIVLKLKGRGIGGMSPPHGGATTSSSSLPQPPQPQQTQQQALTPQQPQPQPQQTMQQPQMQPLQASLLPQLQPPPQPQRLPTPQPPLAQPPQPQPQQLAAAAAAAAAAGAMAAGATAALPVPLLGAPLFPAPIALDAIAAVAQLEAGVELEVPEVDLTPLQVEMLPEGMPGLGAPPSCP